MCTCNEALKDFWLMNNPNRVTCDKNSPGALEDGLVGLVRVFVLQVNLEGGRLDGRVGAVRALVLVLT